MTKRMSHKTKILACIIPLVPIILALASLYTTAPALPSDVSSAASDRTYYEAEHYCIVIYPESRLLSRPETGAEVVYEPRLWDTAFVVASSRNAWKNAPVENERQRIACDKVFFPSGETGWIKKTHILWSESQQQPLEGRLARDNVPLYNQLPDGVEKGTAEADTRCEIERIKILKSDTLKPADADTTSGAPAASSTPTPTRTNTPDTAADTLFFKISLRYQDWSEDQIRNAWVHGKDIRIAYHDALIGTGRRLMQNWRQWKQDHYIGGAELVYRHILENYPRQKYYEWSQDAVEEGVFCGIIALDSLADIYILSRKYEKAVSFLRRIIEEYPDTTGTIGYVMNDWAANGPAGGLARLKIAKVTSEYLKEPLTAVTILQEIISEHGGREIYGFEWNTLLGLEALERIEKIGKQENLTGTFMSEQFRQAVLSSESPFVRLSGTIKQAEYMRNAGRAQSRQAAEELLNMIHKHPAASMIFFKSEVDYSVSALDLSCRIYALDLTDPQKARDICRDIVSRHKETEDCHLDGAALFIKAEILDKTNGTREEVLAEYKEALAQAEYDDVISVIRNGMETQGYIGPYAAKKRIQAIEAFAPLPKTTYEETPLFHYPDTKAETITTLNERTPVTALYKTGDPWYKVTAPNGAIGWAEKSRIDPPLPPSAGYSEWTTHGGTSPRRRGIETENIIKQPNIKLALEDAAVKEVLFFDVNNDGSPDLVLAGMYDRERSRGSRADYHNITVIDGKTEKILWEHETKAFSSFPPPSIIDTTLYVCAYPGILALDIHTGELKWTQNTESAIEPAQPTTHSPHPPPSTEYFYSTGMRSYIFFLNRKDGSLVERIKTDYTLNTSYLSSEDGKLYCGASGKSPDQDRGAVICIDTRSFEILWTHPLETKYVKSTPLLTDTLVITGAGDGIIHALNKQNGETAWTYETGGPISSSPAYRNNIVCAGSEDGSFYAVESDSGKLLWKFESGDKITASPCIAGNVVYTGSYDGYVYALKLADGELLWKYKVGTAVKNNLSSSGPVVAVLADYQKLYLIGER